MRTRCGPGWSRLAPVPAARHRLVPVRARPGTDWTVKSRLVHRPAGPFVAPRSCAGSGLKARPPRELSELAFYSHGLGLDSCRGGGPAGTLLAGVQTCPRRRHGGSRTSERGPELAAVPGTLPVVRPNTHGARIRGGRHLSPSRVDFRCRASWDGRLDLTPHLLDASIQRARAILGGTD